MKTLRTQRHSWTQGRAAVRGLSLVELMVALGIGALLILGATQVYVDGRNSYATNESVARLQETARYALAVIEPDVRMANYWGLLKGASVIANQAAQTAAVSPVANWGDVTVCGDNFAADLNTPLQGDNDGYILSPSLAAGCNSLNGWTTNPVVTSDTLTIRRASVFPSATQNTWLQICSTRIAARLYSDGAACTAAPAGQISNLIVNAYYVDRNSAQQNGMPSLRRKSLVSPVGGPSAFADQEIIAGVEDLQVQFGVDPSGTSGIATRYVNPDAVPANAQIVSVRVWVLVRSDTSEVGFDDDRIYEYGNRLQVNGVTGDLSIVGDAGKAYRPSLNADASFTSVRRFRRLLVSRTIQIRNAIGT